MKTDSQYRQIIATELRKKGIYDQRTEISNTLFGEYLGLSALSTNQLIDFLRHLKKDEQTPTELKDRNPMRKAILHKMHLMGYIDNEAKDSEKKYARMEKFIQNIGANNPKQKKLYSLSYSELVQVTTQINEMYKKSTYGHNKA